MKAGGGWFDVPRFLNMVAGFNTAMPLAELSRRFLKSWEDDHAGRSGQHPLSQRERWILTF